MRISELARKADVSIPTVKFYLRQGLIAEGESTAVTRADYTDHHVHRVRLIRALVEVGGLSLGTIQVLLNTLDEAGTVDAPLSVQKKGRKVAKGAVLKAVHETLPPTPPERRQTPNRALAAISALGWKVDPESVAVRQLEAALSALDTLGLEPSVGTLLSYGEAAQLAANADVAAIPSGPSSKVVRQLVLGTAMYEPMLTALHRLAQQNALKAR
jgi:DNA-binding transcriptional MerR regulator